MSTKCHGKITYKMSIHVCVWQTIAVVDYEKLYILKLLINEYPAKHDGSSRAKKYIFSSSSARASCIDLMYKSSGEKILI